MELDEVTKIRRFVDDLEKDIEGLKEEKRNIIMGHAERLKSLLNEFYVFKENLRNHRRRLNEITVRSTRIIDRLLAEIELAVIEAGGSVSRIRTRIPRDLHKRVNYVKYLIEFLNSINLKRLEGVRNKLQEVYLELESAERGVTKYNKQALKQIKSEILREKAIIDQILHPEQTIIVNTRDRFD